MQPETKKLLIGHHANILLDQIERKAIANYLACENYIVIADDERVSDNDDIEDALLNEGYVLVSTDEKSDDFIEDGLVKVRLNEGSMRDTEAEEILLELHAKHGYNLSTVLRQLL